jgi:tetratricopeptide (TPR) repeat protein
MKWSADPDPGASMSETTGDDRRDAAGSPAPAPEPKPAPEPEPEEHTDFEVVEEEEGEVMEVVPPPLPPGLVEPEPTDAEEADDLEEAGRAPRSPVLDESAEVPVVTGEPIEMHAAEADRDPAEYVMEIEAIPEAESDGQGSAVDFYRKEAKALAHRQPERAALMWIEAAAAAQEASLEQDEIYRDLDAALELLPQSGWLVSRARRMLLRLGSYERALKLGQREAKLGGDSAARAALLLESASVIRYHLGRQDVALNMLRQALEVRPHYVPALTASATICHELGKHAEACEALERLADCLTHPGQRALALYTAASIRELRLGQVEAAQALYQRALEADPKNIPASAALADTYRFNGQWPQLGRTLEHLADVLEDPEIRSELLLEAGTLHVDRTGDLAAATRNLARAARAVPDNPLVLRRLAHVHELGGRTREAIETLHQLEMLTADARGKAGLLTQIGTMYAGLNEPDLAAAAFKQALELTPGYMPAIQEYGTLCRKRGDHEGLVTLGRKESESQLPAVARAVRYLELAELLERRLSRPDEAVEAIQRAIALDPELHLAYWFLASLLRRTGQNAELAQLLREHAAICQDERTRTHLLLETGRLLSTLLDEPEAAIEALHEAGVGSAPASVLFNLVELYTAQARNAELVELLLRHAGLSKDPKESESRRIWAALVLEQDLDEREKALAILREVLKTNPRSYLAIHAIGRILHHQGAWEELVKLYHHELTTYPDRPDMAVMLCRVGRIIAERIGSASAAIGAYTRALRHDPCYTPALGPLEHLARREGKWSNLVEALQGFARATGDSAAAAAALCRAAELVCWELDQPDEARGLFQEALEREPSSRAVRLGMARVHMRQQAWADAAKTLEELATRVDEGERRSLLLLQLARLREFNLGLPADLGLYREAAEGPFASQLQEEVLRVRRLEKSEGLPVHLARIGEQSQDDAMAAAYLLDAAHLGEFGDLGGRDILLEVAKMAHERQSDLAAAWTLERALTRHGQWQELAELTEHLAQLELDRNVRIQQLAMAGQAYFRAGAYEDAERVSRECLNFDAHSLPALRTLSLIAESREEWRQLAELRDRIAEACTDSTNRLNGCLTAAETWLNKVGDRSRALASLSVALADNPNHLEAFSRAESLLRERGDFEEISRLYQRRIRATGDDRMLADLHWQHARILRDDIRRPDRAISELNQMLRLAPGNTGGLSALADLHEELGHWSDVASTLETLTQKTDDPLVRRDAQLRLARLWLERLHDLGRAREALEAAAANTAHDDLEIVRLEVRLAVMNGEWDKAQSALQQLLESGDGGAQAWAQLQLAEIARTGQRDEELARRHTADALERAATDVAALAEFRRRIFPTRDDKRRLVQMAEEALESGAGEDPEALRQLVVRLLLDDLDDPDRALPHIEALRSAAPGSVDIAVLEAQALERSGNPADACARYMRILETDSRCGAAYRGLSHCASGPTAAAAASICGVLGELDEKGAAIVQRIAIASNPAGAFPAFFVQPSVEERRMEELIEILTPALAEVFPRPRGEPVAPNQPVARAVASVARTLGLLTPSVEVAGQHGAKMALDEERRLQVSASLCARPAEAEFRGWVGRALVAGPCGALFDQLTDLQLAELADALSGRRPRLPNGQQLRKNLLTHLSRKARRELDQIELQEVELERVRLATQSRADRVAVVLGLHAGRVVQTLAQAAGVAPAEMHDHKRFAGLFRFALSDDHARLVQAVWGDVI